MAGGCEERLLFEMGLYKAYFPTDLVYVSTHFWFKPVDGKYRAGISAYAGRLLTDLFRIDWKVKVGDKLALEMPDGSIQVKKLLLH